MASQHSHTLVYASESMRVSAVASLALWDFDRDISKSMIGAPIQHEATRASILWLGEMMTAAQARNLSKINIESPLGGELSG